MNSNESWDYSGSWSKKEKYDPIQINNNNEFLKKKRFPNDRESKGAGNYDNNGGKEGNELFIKGFSSNFDESDLRGAFEKFGKIRFVKVLKKEDGSSKGIGFVTFFNQDDAREALTNAENINLDGKKVIINYSKGKKDKDNNSNYNNNNNNERKENNFKSDKEYSNKGKQTPYVLFVSNLNFKAKESDISNFFGSSVSNVKFLLNDEGKSKGCCFVSFTDENSMNTALTKNGVDLLGRKVKVEKKRENGEKRDNNFRNDRPQRNYKESKERSWK